MYEVISLKEGYSIKEGPGQQKACGSITLLKGPQNIIVDTGNPWDKDLILEGLKQYSLTPERVQYVVGTHGHSDHIGNLNLFTNAIHIVSHDICVGDQYQLHDFQQGIPYEIDDNVEVISTPGHTGSDVSVIARNTQLGKVAITGDLFECYEDLEDYTLWQDNSEDPDTQLQNRMSILKMVDWIVPGHGPKFKVPDEYKKQMRMVMYYESQTYDSSSGMETSESSCIVVEED